MAVSLHAVIFGVVASLALLCGLICLVLRGQSALVWLAAGLACGAVETVVLGIDGGSIAARAAVTMLIPAAYLCAIARTDDALYRAKREGRNRVAVHAATAKPARLVAAA